MIEVTDEMISEAYEMLPGKSAATKADVADALAAAFAIVEREHEVRRLTPAVSREHASADEHGIIRCHTPGPDGAQCERTPEHRGLHAFYGDDGRPDGPGELVRW